MFFWKLFIIYQKNILVINIIRVFVFKCNQLYKYTKSLHFMKHTSFLLFRPLINFWIPAYLFLQLLSHITSFHSKSPAIIHLPLYILATHSGINRQHCWVTAASAINSAGNSRSHNSPEVRLTTIRAWIRFECGRICPTVVVWDTSSWISLGQAEACFEIVAYKLL